MSLTFVAVLGLKMLLACRSVMRQLISRFQRTSCTPRNISLNTPKYSKSNQLSSVSAVSMMNEMLPGYSADGNCGIANEAFDPNCFEV